MDAYTKISDEEIEVTKTLKRRISKARLLAQKARIEEQLAAFETEQIATK